MPEIAKAYVQIVPSAQGMKGSIEAVMGGEADKAGASAGAGFSKAFGGALKGIGTVAAAAFTAAATAATAAAKGVLDTAAIGDNIDKMSQKMGMSAQAYQEWDAIMQHSGTTIESMQAGMKTLATAAETGNKAFEALGISQEQLASMSQEELFGATITALQNVGSETERTYLAGQLLGRGATELGALLNTSAEDTEAMRQRVHELGGVMSDEAVKAAAGLTDSLQDMKTALAGIGRSMASDLLPGVKEVVDGLTEMFGGDSDKGIGMIKEGVSNLLENINAQLPKFLEIGGGIIESIGQAIIENLPEFIKVGVDIIVSLIDSLAENFDQLVDAAVEIILTLADALIENIDKVIEATIRIVTAIVEKLTEPETLEALIEAAIKIIIAIAEGLIKALPQLAEALAKVLANILMTIGKWGVELFEKGKEIVQHIADGIAEAVKNAVNWGRDLIDNFVQGIKDRIQRVIDTIKDLAQQIKDYLGFSEPDIGPLANFHTFAPDMMELFAQGIRDNEHLITDQIADSFDVGTQMIDVGMGAMSTQTLAATPDADRAQAEQPITLMATINLDGQQLWEGLLPYKRFSESLAGVGVINGY